MKILWIDLNSSYAHSSLALPALHAQIANAPSIEWAIVSATINENVGTVVDEAYRHKPDIIAATTWLFNHEQLLHITSRLKVLLPEALPSLLSGITVTGISLISYTAMAGAIGAGGLGNLAYLYGFARRNDLILYTSTVIIIIIVFVIQWIGDAIVKRIDKR